MKKALLIALSGLVVAGVGRYVVYPMLVSDETRVRWVIEGAVAGFNRPDVGDTTVGLADDFEHGKNSFSRDEVRQFLAGLFLTRRDPKTKKFRLRVELLPEDLIVELDPKQDGQASASATVRMFDTRESRKNAPPWEVRIDAVFEETDDGWKIIRSTHETLSGRKPF